MDARRAPGWVLRDHAKDQITHFLGDPLPADHSTGSGQDTPIQGESGSVPAHHSLRTDDDQSLFPSGPETSCQDPEGLIEDSQPRPPPLQRRELLPECEVFKQQLASGVEEPKDCPCQQQQCISHVRFAIVAGLWIATPNLLKSPAPVRIVANHNPIVRTCGLRDGKIEKLSWNGVLISIQPRIRLTRSFDQRSHTYLGYALRVRGSVGREAREFLVGVGEGAHAKCHFQAGAAVSGEATPVADARLETVEFYKVSNLNVTAPETVEETQPPPWHGIPPPLPVYRERSHRRLATRTYQDKCTTCIWGCHMAVEMIIDQWNPSKRRYRTETFCYGPRSCPLYHSGPARTVPGRHGMSYTEEDWIDDEATAHRGLDE